MVVEPFMSSAGVGGCDYTSSPQISLKPSPSQEPNMSRHSSFVSPNRTCYLSPTGAVKTKITGLTLGLYVLVLEVKDNSGNTARDQTEITVTQDTNQAPL